MMQRIARIEIAAAIVLALLVALSGPGYRAGWWGLSTAFGLMRWSAWIAIGVFVVAIAHGVLWHRQGGMPPPGRNTLAAVLVTCVAAAAFPLWFAYSASHVPPIHDITTDTDNPPALVAIAPLRAQARNPIAYEGEAVARQQKAAYPDIRPVELPVPPAQAFDRALRAARAMGWTIIDESAQDGRIEASDTTPFFGFSDDIVVRVTANGTGSRIDVRSLSRIGRSDIGANARRVRRYVSTLVAD